MKKWTFVMVIITALTFGSVIGFNFFVNEKVANAIANMPEVVYPVTAINVTDSTWQPTINAIGFVDPHQSVSVSNEVAGIISAINFENGSQVKAEQVLVELDSKVERANLKSKQVQIPAAEADFKRLTKLYKQNSVSKQDLDNSQAKYLALMADNESLSATIERREIKAPFSGLIGIRNVNLGEYLQTGSDIVQLEDIRTMKIRFTIAQTQLPHIETGQTVHVYVEAYPTEPFEGTISAIEPAVFYQSGLIQIQAQIPNSHRKLRSGMFAKVDILLPELTQQVVIPQIAISYTLYGDYVFVIEELTENSEQIKRVKQVNVKVLERDNNNALLSGSIKSGDVIVTSGQVRLSNNSKVEVTEDYALIPPATLPIL